MPASIMSFFPQFLSSMVLLRSSMKTNVSMVEREIRAVSRGFDLIREGHERGVRAAVRSLPLFLPAKSETSTRFLEGCEEEWEKLFSICGKNCLGVLETTRQELAAGLEFVDYWMEEPPPQKWHMGEGAFKVLLDLPGLRLIDISRETSHRIRNYTVVFAPRAGHNSNIVERVSLYMRDHGLTRMAVVEQKCADEIPLLVDGKKHREDFDSQVSQYKKILEYLNAATGCPPHLVAICQPGPLLMSTLILNPHLGKTFGSAGSPMDTEGERGFLTDLARTMGESFVDLLTRLFRHRVPEGNPGEGRAAYDGRAHVLGFYLLGKEQHMRNLRKLLTDLKTGNKADAERQKVFYQWYNMVNHLPVEFIKDTFNKVFLRNELARGTLEISGRRISIGDYPSSVPIWALGGRKDDITPPLQATGHMRLLRSVPESDKLTLLCDGGHMGLFRSSEILKNFYSRIVEFMLSHSDWAEPQEETDPMVLPE